MTFGMDRLLQRRSVISKGYAAAYSEFFGVGVLRSFFSSENTSKMLAR